MLKFPVAGTPTPSDVHGTISIVSHGHREHLRALLGDLRLQVGIERYLVVVTLNLQYEAFDAAEWEGMRLHVIRNPQPKGFGANHNQAFQVTGGDWFLIVNPDIRLPRAQTLQELLTTSRPADAAALRAPRVLGPTGQPEDSVRRNLTPWSLLGRTFNRQRGPLDAAPHTQLGQPFFWLAGMFLAIERQAFASIGGFDERFFLYCEDYDLCARLYINGHRLAVSPVATVMHDARRDSHRSPRHMRWHVRSLLSVWTSRAFWRVVLHSR